MKQFSIGIFIASILLLNSCKTIQEVAPTQVQGGGMWIPTEVNEAEMKAMGMKLNADDLFSSGTKSLNSAIPHFNRGCTSEVISPKGLLLTNHHCGYGEIQSHSTVENDYLTDGFWAYSLEEELVNKNTTATFITNIEEVTTNVMSGVSANLSEEQKLTVIQENIKTLKQNSTLEPFQEIEIKSYYDGNKYYKITSETFKDVRLVGAPPSSIGKYGSDTDNWVWPRHTGDFSLFRIYADKNNKPAEYSEDNVPYTPKQFLPVSIKGVKKDDFTMVYGFPGRTQEYLPASALVNITQTVNPTAIKIREVALGILDKKMRTDNETRIKYASKFARISNYHKKWIGENLGIEKSGAINKKREYEAQFTQNIQTLENKNEYVQVLPKLNALYKEQKPYAKVKTSFDEAIVRNSETYKVAVYMNQLLKANEGGQLDNYKGRLQNYLSGLYKNYNSDLDEEVSYALIQLYNQYVKDDFKPASISAFMINFDNSWKQSFITGKQQVNGANINTNINKVFEDNTKLIAAIKKDPIVKMVGEIEKMYSEKVETKYYAIQDKIDALQKVYMKGQMQAFPNKKFFPDANSTLRVTYGKVNGYPKEDGTMYNYQTYVDGMMDKYIPGDYEFDLSEKMLDLYKTKDYGQYAEDGKMPVNFIASNHTTGGNSGSPALDANGNLIGLNFDRVWEGTMSDLYYDPKICRNIMVDARFILFIIDKYANAQNLINEMTIIK